MNALYGDRASLYDKVYTWIDYPGGAAQVVQALGRLGISAPARVLEGGCGTGKYLEHFPDGLTADGFDLAPEMVALARERVPNSRVWVDDLRSFEVERPYDAFVCLFGTIGYLIGIEALSACAASVARAVRPGGALVIEPWFPVDMFMPGLPGMDVCDEPELKIARMIVGELHGDVAHLPMRFMIARPNRPVETFEDVHRLWCAPTQVVLDAFDAAGFDVTYEVAALGPYHNAILGRRR